MECRLTNMACRTNKIDIHLYLGGTPPHFCGGPSNIHGMPPSLNGAPFLLIRAQVLGWMPYRASKLDHRFHNSVHQLVYPPLPKAKRALHFRNPVHHLSKTALCYSTSACRVRENGATYSSMRASPSPQRTTVVSNRASTFFRRHAIKRHRSINIFERNAAQIDRTSA